MNVRGLFGYRRRQEILKYLHAKVNHEACTSYVICGGIAVETWTSFHESLLCRRILISWSDKYNRTASICESHAVLLDKERGHGDEFSIIYFTEERNGIIDF